MQLTCAIGAGARFPGSEQMDVGQYVRSRGKAAAADIVERLRYWHKRDLHLSGKKIGHVKDAIRHVK